MFQLFEDFFEIFFIVGGGVVVVWRLMKALSFEVWFVDHILLSSEVHGVGFKFVLKIIDDSQSLSGEGKIKTDLS